jgi:hypothetical protein
MQFTFSAVMLASGLFAAMLVCLEIGRRVGMRRALREGEADREGFGVVEGAVFALLGLLVAFTFSGASARFDERRQLVIDEANAIGTAWLRIDLLPAEAQPEMRQSFRDYLDARLAAYRAVPDMDAVNREIARVNQIQQRIWTRAVAAASGSQPATMLLLPALNEMFDIASTRVAVTRAHPPAVVFALLFAFSLLGALLAGNAMAGATAHRWLHTVTFAFALAGAVYVILDMEYPRLGFIRVDAFDQLLVDLREGMR